MKKLTACLLIFCLLFSLCAYAEDEVADTIEAIYENLIPTADGLYRAQKDGKWGIIDEDETVVRPFTWDYLGEESEARTLILSDNLYGYLSPDGRIAILPSYSLARSFHNGYAAVMSEGKWGFIDKNGNTVVAHEYEDVGDFSDGISCVKKDGMFGYVDAKGETVIDFTYTEAYDFSDGLACVGIDGKYGYINTDGMLAIAAEYDVALPFSETLAAVCKNGKWGYIDKNGKPAIALTYSYAEPFINGKASIRKNGKVCIIDTNGDLVFPAKFEEVGTSGSGLYPVKTNGKWGYADESGNVTIEASFDAALPFSKNAAAVMSGELWGLINKNGEFLTDAVYSELSYGHNNTVIYRAPNGLYDLMCLPEKPKPTISNPAGTRNYIHLQIGNPVIDICGETETLLAAPVIENDRTLLPIRAVAEALGASVDWDGKTQRITITKKDTEIVLKLSSTRALVNGIYYPLDVAPFLSDDTTMVPLRFVTQTLGVIPEWNGETKEIYLYY